MTNLPSRLVVACTLFLTTAATAAPPNAAEIAQAIKELEDKRFAVREKASEFLRAAGRSAEPALRQALANRPSLEMRQRLERILDDFNWGIYPDTPTEVLRQIQAYRGGDGSAKRQAVEALAKLGSAGYGTLLKMATAEDEETQRQFLLQYLALQMPRAVPQMMLDGKEEEAELFVETMAGGRKEDLVRHYAAYLFQRGRLGAKIPALRSAVAKPKGGDAAWVLSYLHRAGGDLRAAREMAEKADDKALTLLILAEEQNWKELAKRTAATGAETDSDVETLAFRAAYQRVAGQPADFEKTVAALRKAAAAEPEGSPAWQIAKALFLNDRPADGLGLLTAKKHDLAAFDVLKAQTRYADALDLAGKSKPDSSTTWPHHVALRQATLLHYLGDREKAQAALGRAAELVRRDGTPTPHQALMFYTDLVRAELGLGETDPALEHCAEVLARTWKAGSITAALDGEAQTQLFDLLFPQRGATAVVWWDFLRKKHAGEKGAATMKRLRGLLNGRVVGEELAKLAEELERSAKADRGADREPLLLAIAEVCEAANALEGAEIYLKKWTRLRDTALAWQRLGDFTAKHGNDANETADCYDKAFRKDTRQPLPLFLRGQILLRTGRKDEGRRLIELSHRLPLGDEETRYVFAGALDARGFPDDARREYEMILRTGPGEGWYNNETLRHLAYEAMSRKDYTRAAELFERFRVCCLRMNTSFVEYSAYVHVPAMVHQNQARAALRAGKFDDAKRAVEQILSLLPGSVELPIELVAALDRAGRREEGDEIFRRVFNVYDKRCAEFPRSAVLQNSAAWMAAACRRELDRALAHAEKAVSLAPKEAGYLDTLAEVCFQRGDRERAAKLMKRCIELEPGNDYFPRQLKRIENGDPKAPLPEAG